MGERIEVWSQGVLVEVHDTRTIEEERAKKIAEIKENTSKEILAAVPQHTQSNIALGIVSEEEASASVKIILEKRGVCNQLCQMILRCNTISELDALLVSPTFGTVGTPEIQLPPIPSLKSNVTDVTDVTSLPDKPSDLISFLKSALTKLSEILK